jgi:hypothetical protein
VRGTQLAPPGISYYQHPARSCSASTGEFLVPKSRLRKKSDYTPPPSGVATVKLDSGRHWLALFLIGLAWIVVFYVTGSSWPIKAWSNWNILVGFGFIAGGFGVSTQWK